MLHTYGFKKFGLLFGILFLLVMSYAVHAQNNSNKGIRVIGNTSPSVDETQSAGQGLFGKHFMFLHRIKEFHGLCNELNLTSEQKTALAALKGTCRVEVKAAMEQHLALRKEVLAQTPNEAAIQNVAAELGQAIGVAAVKVSSVVGQIREILTDEQEALLKSSMEEHLKNKEDHLEALHGILDELIPTPPSE